MTWQVAAVTIGVLALPLEPMLISLGRPGAVVAVQISVCLSFLGALQLLLPAFGLSGAGAGLVAADLALGLYWFVRQVRASSEQAETRAAALALAAE